ncbi:MAG TPA: error-prone DNA polymerase [Roseococcus sp.]|nr:error-prone DNA polymerase [Roseococcus sp.]
MTTPFAELAARSNFSFLDGASHPAELVEAARRLGHAGLGICDTNSLGGVVRGHVAAKEAGLPFAVGCRLALEDGGGFLVWPTGRDGYGRLTALLSRARMRDDKDACRIARAEAIEAAGDWAMAALPPAWPDAAFAAQFAADAAALEGRLALPLLLAASRNLLGHDQARLDRLARIAGEEALLAGGDVRFHAPHRRRLADVLTAIRLRTTVDALGFHAEPNAERHLKPCAEMARLFARHPEALRNTLRVLEASRGFSLDQLRYEYPEEVLEPGRTAQETLERRVAAAAAQRWPHGTPSSIAERIAHELRLIGQLGYAPYFLTVHEIVAFARARGILCQGRGSAANSSVCYALGITAVDPAKHDLLFERFLSASRGEPPDIDIDFEHERREEVIQYVYDKYGRDRAALTAVVISYRPKSAFRDVGKALGFAQDKLDALSANFMWWDGRDVIPERLTEVGLDIDDLAVQQLMRLTAQLLNMPRHMSQHPGGFVLTKGPLTRMVPVENAAMADRTIVEWDKDDLDALGLLKVDVLALGMLSAIRRTLAFIGESKGHVFEMQDIPAEDEATYDMICKADTIGVFQIESRAQMSMLPRLRPRCFYDLVIEVAIVRPGPIQGQMVHPFLNRRQGKEPVSYPSEALKEALGRTLGVPIFQEQVMQVAILAAGFTAGEADQLRRSMAAWKRKGGLQKYYDKIVNGMTSRGYEEAFAKQIFEQIKGFSEYGFPESHAASFALLVYASCWLKCHHPAEFLAAMLNSQPLGFYSASQLVQDAQRHDVVVRAPDVMASSWDCTLEDRPGMPAVRLGLRLINGLKEASARRVVAARAEAPFDSAEDLARRADLEQHEMRLLASADALASLSGHRRQQVWDAAALRRPPKLLREAPVDEAFLELNAALEGEEVVHDYETIGLTLRSHPLALLRPHLARRRLAAAADLEAARDGQFVRYAGIVTLRQQPETANGTIFISLEDETGVVQVIVWKSLRERQRPEVLRSRLLAVYGKWQREGDVKNLIAARFEDLTPLLGKLATSSRDFR